MKPRTVTANKPKERTQRAVSHIPHINSYDSGYEFSVEHLLDVRRLVESADEEGEKKDEAAA